MSSKKYFIKDLSGELRQRLEIWGPSNLEEAIQYALQQEHFLSNSYSETNEIDLKKELSRIQYELRTAKKIRT